MVDNNVKPVCDMVDSKVQPVCDMENMVNRQVDTTAANSRKRGTLPSMDPLRKNLSSAG